jgi:serralysin
LVAIVSVAASAQGSTFRISQVFSNYDGSIQFIELTESGGVNGQQRLTGLILTSTRDGVVKQYTFSHDLPTDQTAHMSIVVATSGHLPGLRVTAIDPTYCGGCPCHIPDFASMPIRSIPTDGGTLDFAGIDHMTYASLPTDGVTALHRDGSVRQATVPSRYAAVICEQRYTIAQSHVFAIEYYNAVLDNYFVTASVPDIDALDNGRLAGWM